MNPSPRASSGGFPIADLVDPEEIEAEVNEWMAASEPQRRAERLDCGIVDAELVDEPECEHYRCHLARLPDGEVECANGFERCCGCCAPDLDSAWEANQDDQIDP